MDRSTHSTARPKHLEQNLKKSDSRIFNNTDVSDSVANDDTSLPTLRSITQSKEKIIFPSIQIQNHRNNSSIKRQYDDSSVVESTSYSGGEFIDGFKKSASEPTLSSRMSSKQENNVSTIYEAPPIHFLEHMPPSLIRKILVEPFIDLNDIPATSKNLMNFANTSKFNREFMRELLSVKSLKEDSFEITKSVIPNLLATLANDKKEKFTQSDIDYLVHKYPYLTVDCSYQKKIKFTNRGLEALKKIVSHSGLREIRIISNLAANNQGVYESFTAYSNNCLELIDSLLSRKSSSPVKVDLIFKNWLPPLNSKNELENKSFETIKRIQNKANTCDNVIFGEINLSYKIWDDPLGLIKFNPCDKHLNKYRLNFIKMMCNIAVTHSAHTICLKGMALYDAEFSLILNEITKFDKSSLRHLDLSGNRLGKANAERLGTLLPSENTCLKTLKLNNMNLFEDDFNILDEILKTNRSLELVEIKDVRHLRKDHPLRNDKRVKITEAELIW